MPIISSLCLLQHFPNPFLLVYSEKCLEIHTPSPTQTLSLTGLEYLYGTNAICLYPHPTPQMVAEIMLPSSLP